MFDDLRRDVQQLIRQGHSLTKIILLNIALWVLLVLLRAFAGPMHAHATGIAHIPLWAIPSSPLQALITPWTWLTYAFTHFSLWNLIWEMLLLWWSGSIVGDLIGDKHVRRLFITGVLTGALGYILSGMLFHLLGRPYTPLSGTMPAVLTMMTAAATLAPSYQVRLLLLGNVKISLIAGVFFFGYALLLLLRPDPYYSAVLLSALAGYYYIKHLYTSRHSLLDIFGWSKIFPKKPKRSKPRIFTMHSKNPNTPSTTIRQEDIDAILDKINRVGFDALTPEEKEILYQAAKQKGNKPD